MGLDQYAHIRRPDETQEEAAEICYWRKHPNLQGWMRQLYEKRGGQGEFNCGEVQLLPEDIDKLEIAIKESNLPSTSGFFYGTEKDEQMKEKDLLFIDLARKAFDADLEVYYSSWW